jgi:hypothetical protein
MHQHGSAPGKNLVCHFTPGTCVHKKYKPNAMVIPKRVSSKNIKCNIGKMLLG